MTMGARGAQPVPRAGQRDDARHGREHLFVLLIGNIFGVLAASTSATSSLTCSRCRLRAPAARPPNWPRPIAGHRLDADAGILLRGASSRSSAAGSRTPRAATAGQEKVIGIAVLAIGLLLSFVRRIVQDGERPHWREETPDVPSPEEQAAIDMELRPSTT
jgi:hypothetical protein